MVVMVDEVREYPLSRVPAAGRRHGRQWARLTVDEEDEETDHHRWLLHAFAGKLGLHHDWFQRRGGQAFYYVTPAKREQALRLGAVFVPAAEQERRRALPRQGRLALRVVS